MSQQIYTRDELEHDPRQKRLQVAFQIWLQGPCFKSRFYFFTEQGKRLLGAQKQYHFRDRPR